MILQKVNNGSALCKFDLVDKENILSYNKINIGCGATKVINSKIRACTATASEMNIRENVLYFFPQFFIKCLNEALWNIVSKRDASSLSVTNRLSIPDISANRFKNMCCSLCEVKKVQKTATYIFKSTKVFYKILSLLVLNWNHFLNWNPSLNFFSLKVIVWKSAQYWNRL